MLTQFGMTLGKGVKFHVCLFLSFNPASYRVRPQGFFDLSPQPQCGRKTFGSFSVTETFGRKKIAAQRGYFGHKNLFRPQKIVIFWSQVASFGQNTFFQPQEALRSIVKQSEFWP